MGDCGVRVRVALLLTFLITASLLTVTAGAGGVLQARAQASGGWRVFFEEVSESKYGFSLMEVASAVKLVLYMDSSGDVNNDWIKIVVMGDAVVINGSVIERYGYIVGYSKVGYEGDGKANVRGLHVIYYLLPNVTYLTYVEIVLHSDHGFPRLNTVKSWAEAVNVTSYYWMSSDERGNYGTYYSSYVSPAAGELKVAVVSHGLATEEYKASSGVSYYYGRAFKPEMSGSADIYVDVGYMGGVNIAPESTYGTGRYTIKLDVGVEQALSIGEVMSDPDYETLLYRKGGGGVVELVTKFAADRVEDVMLDLITDFGIDFITSPVGRIALRSIPYVTQIIEWAEMLWSLTYDEVINESKRVVFSNVHIDPMSGGLMYVWTHFIGMTESTGISTGLINFCGDPPWQNILDTYFGIGVWRLKYGGIYVGGVVLDYFNVPEVISELPQGERYPATVNISIVFSKPIDSGSLPPHGNSIKVYVSGVERSFLDYFRYSLKQDNTTLLIQPNYHLDYGRAYVVELTQGIRGSDGTNLVKSYNAWFFTEVKQQVGPVTYYVMPTATSTEIPNHLAYVGKLFKAYYHDEIMIDWNKAGLNEVTFRLMSANGPELKALYVGEATFYTNDVNIDYYDSGSGRLYLANNTLWFTPLTAEDWGLPPHRGEFVFSLGEAVSILHPQPARLVVSWLRTGNSRIEKTLRDAGVVEGTLLDLEPVPVMNYALVSSLGKIGEGVVLSGSEPGLNGTKLALYLVTTLDRQTNSLDYLLRDYTPMYKNLGGLPVDGDVFVFIVTNVTYMRAWRLAPLGHIPYAGHSKTYVIRLSDLGQSEITIVTNTTIREIDKSNLPYEIRLITEGIPGNSGYIVLTIPKQLNITVKSATVDGKPAAVEALNQTLFSNTAGARLTYRYTQRNTTIVIILQPITAEQQPEQPTLSSSLISLLIAVAIVATTLTVIVRLRILKRRDSSLGSGTHLLYRLFSQPLP